MKMTETKPEIQRELTPELADKIWKSIEKIQYDNRVSKEKVLHHLKQLKAEFGKVRKKVGFQNGNTKLAIDTCMSIIDKKIQKISQ